MNELRGSTWDVDITDAVRQCNEMMIFNSPPQDAPALGYLPSLREYIGAVDATPPVVGRHDPIADLVKAYKLIRDHPEYS